MTKNGEIVNQALSKKIFIIIINHIEEETMNDDQDFTMLEEIMNFLIDIID